MQPNRHIDPLLYKDSSQARLEILLQYAGDIIFIFNEQFEFTQFFVKDTTNLYLEPKDFLNKYIGDVNLPEDLKAKTIWALKECITKRKTIEFEYSILLSNRLEWYSSRTTPIIDSDDNIIELICVLTNINNSILKKHELERKQKQSELFNKILIKLSTTPIESFESFEKAVQQVALIATQHIACSQISIWDAEQSEVKCITIASKDGISSSGVLTSFDKTDYPFYFSTLEQGTSIIAEDTEASPYLQEFLVNYLRPQNIRSTMDVPMRLDGKLIGIICCEHKYDTKKWTSEEESFIRMLADVLSIIKETFRRKEAEHKLNDTQKLLEDAYKISKMGVWEYDYINKKLFFSEIIRAFLKVPPDFEPTTDNIIRFFKSKDDYEKAKKNIIHVARTKGAFEISLDLYSFDKEEINTRITGNPEFKDNQLVRIYGCIQDISEITNVKKDLKQSEDNFNIINQTINDVYWLYNFKEHRYEFVSPNSEMVIGKTPDEFYSDNNLISNIVVEEDKEVHRYSEEEIRKHGFSEAEFRIHVNGHLTWFRERRQAIYNEQDGSLHRVSGVITDITNLKKIESELAEAKHLEETNKIKAQFLANISHEIRTPLNGIIGVAELLKYTNLSSEQREYLDVIFASSKQLMDIVNEILDFSKSESGKLSLNISPCNIHTLFYDVVNMLKHPIEEKNIEFIYKIDEHIPEYLETDELKLKQVLINLLGNAYKFTKHGKIEFSCQLLAKSDSCVTIRFQIEDTGIGIKPENLKVIFEAFVQEDLSSTKSYGGTGLGLTICSNLLKLMNSEIVVESTPNKGSVFFFDLTLQQKEPSDITQLAPQTKSNTSLDITDNSNPEIKVLIVDDNTVNYFLLNSIISSLLPKAQILHSANGQSAVECYAADKADIIFMDIQMPVLNGFEASKKIRDLDPNHETIIIGTSAGNNATIHKDCIASGMNDFLPKPLVKKDVDTLLRKWIPTYTKKQRETQSESLPQNINSENLHIDYSELKHSLETNHAFMKAFMPHVRESLQEGLKELYEHYINKDLESLSIVAHRVKGTALTACLPILTNLAKELELTSTFDEQKIAGLLQRIDDEINEIIKLI